MISSSECLLDSRVPDVRYLFLDFIRKPEWTKAAFSHEALMPPQCGKLLDNFHAIPFCGIISFSPHAG